MPLEDYKAHGLLYTSIKHFHNFKFLCICLLWKCDREPTVSKKHRFWMVIASTWVFLFVFLISQCRLQNNYKSRGGILRSVCSVYTSWTLCLSAFSAFLSKVTSCKPLKELQAIKCRRMKIITSLLNSVESPDPKSYLPSSLWVLCLRSVWGHDLLHHKWRLTTLWCNQILPVNWSPTSFVLHVHWTHPSIFNVQYFYKRLSSIMFLFF